MPNQITSFDQAAQTYENDAGSNVAKLLDTPVPADVIIGAAAAQALLAISFRLGDIAQAIREQHSELGRPR